MERERSADPQRDAGRDERIVLKGEEARQGHIVLTSRTRRAIFVGGLVLFVVIAALGGALLY